MDISIDEGSKKKQEILELYKGYRQFVDENYVKLDPSIFDVSNWPMNEKLMMDIESGNEDAIRSDVIEVYPGVFCFSLVPEDFCEKLLNEMDHFESFAREHELLIQRPNTMNNYGAILDDFGFSETMMGLVKKLMNPLSKIFYPHIGDTLNSQHGFIVSYQIGKDTKLDFHVDDSEVTLNISLGKTFEGGGLYFGGVRCENHQQDQPLEEEEFIHNHKPGTAILHLGKHRHLATPITSGERHNLILWCRSSTIRKSENRHQCQPWCGKYKKNGEEQNV